MTSTALPDERGRAPQNSYGYQQRHTWEVAEQEPKPLLSIGKADSLWRVSAQGVNVVFQLVWGTKATRRLTNLLSPLVAFIPGACEVNASKVNAQATASADLTCTPVSGEGNCCQLVRQAFAANPAAAVPLGAWRFTALVASTVTLQGNAVALAAGASLVVDDRPGNTILGAGYVDFIT